jgi:hypothetical protein
MLEEVLGSGEKLAARMQIAAQRRKEVPELRFAWKDVNKTNIRWPTAETVDRAW